MKIKVRCWNGETMISPDYVDRDGVAWWKENSIPTSSKDTMLWTGFEDTKGTEIFHHDYIQNASGRICEVVWNEFHGCWDATPVKMVQDDSQVGFLCAQWGRWVTVVGNSLANPELLEVQE